MEIDDELYLPESIQIEKEAFYLYTLKGMGIPKIISYGTHKKYYVLVEQLLGKSLQQIFINNTNTNYNKIKRQKDIIIACLQALDRIEFIHSKLLLHLDVKPDNFLIGEPDSSLVYIIDFGFAKKYRSSRTGKHIAYSKNGYFNGNLRYASINTMKGISPSRRDDLESLGYMMIYLYNQKLPWNDLPSKNRNILAQKIYEIKKQTKMENLCIEMPEEMLLYMNYVKSLKFEQEPNYNYLKNLFQNLLKKYDKNENPIFSWIKRPLTQRDSDYLIKSFRKRKMSPFSKILNRIANKSTLEVIPKFEFANNLKLQSLEKEKCLTQRKKEIPQIINNNDLFDGYNGYNLKKNVIIRNILNSNENLEKNKMKMINKRLEMKKNNLILRNQYNQIFNNSNKKYINTFQINTDKNKSSIIDSGLYSPNQINSYNNSDKKNTYNISVGNNNSSINYNFVITPYIANKTINIFSNNSNHLKNSPSQQKIKPQNHLKRVLNSKPNSSNNINKIRQKNSFPFNRNKNNMNYGFSDFMISEKKNKQPNLGNTNSYLESSINYRRKFWK